MSRSAASCATFPTETIGWLLVRHLKVGYIPQLTKIRTFPANATLAASEVNMEEVKVIEFS